VGDGEEGGRPVGEGAEASIRAVDWWGFPAFLKAREPKKYRPKALDERLRRERTRNEARLLVEARRLGIRTPLIYDLDLDRCRLILEQLPGPTLKEVLGDAANPPAVVEGALRRLGEALGRLHAGHIAHGDLTSSNVLLPDGPGGSVAFLDLSMGSRNAGLEELGIDLHLVEEDIKALSARAPSLLRAFYAGYSAGNPAGGQDVRARARAIRGRVRYA
jgi:Kae1-associated kinase Bud32